MPDPAPTGPDPGDLARLAATVAGDAARFVRTRLGRGATLSTKSSPTDVVTQTDLDSERMIRAQLSERIPGAGFVGEEGGNTATGQQLQWIVDPLDGTVNFLYGLPVLAVSIAAAVDGQVVAGAVVDVLRGETFSASLGQGARVDDIAITVSGATDLAHALVTTGFSYDADTRAAQGRVVARALPRVRDVRCFGSAALQICWVACGRTDAYFERDIKVWDYAAAALVASEAGAAVELACPENQGLVAVASPGVFAAVRDVIEADD